MRKFYSYLLVLSLFLPMGLFSQSDSLSTKPLSKVRLDTNASIEGDSLPKTRPTERNPGRAALMSAVVPGLGQIYNKKYWKLPIIYSGLGVATYFILQNRKNYLYYKEAFVRDTNYKDGDVSIYFESPETQQRVLEAEKNAVDQSRTYMEYSYIAFGVVYFLQIVDAAVDAHLFYFDVSDDLSMRVTPMMNYTASREPINGLRLTLTF